MHLFVLEFDVPAKEGSKRSAFQGLTPNQLTPSESLVVSLLAVCYNLQVFHLELLLLLLPPEP